MVAASVLGLAGVVLSFARGGVTALDLAWFLPWGSFRAAVDPLSAFFLCLVFTVPALGAVYGLGYWKHAEHGAKGQRLGLAYGLLAGGMAMVVIARDAVLFLISWELMALAAWLAATAEDDRPEVRRAGWIYLIATHIGSLSLFAMFALWRGATGSFALEAAGTLPPAAAAWIFSLALLGFGFKAGLMPLHVWLPGAHANAPSHVSAVMSGVMLKMGVYGIIRMNGLLPVAEAWMGGLLLGVGALTGLAGIAFAIGQQDLKRSLAYSSIENVGIIAMGMGLALLGRAKAMPELAVLGLAGALLHAWNHGLFKALLFLNAGAVIHTAGTRDLERMGGLAKRMPFSAALFALGAVAIAGLPPLNGFVGEWLLYLGFFKALAPGAAPGLAAAAVAAVVLATIGALAVAAFVRLFGAVFLGEGRSGNGLAAHDPVLSMKVPMAILALACAAIGLVPTLVLPALGQATAAWLPSGEALPDIAALAPLGWLGRLAPALLGAAALLYALLALRRRATHGAASGSAAARPPTWDCGYARPGARMEYTASSFGRSIVGLFSFLLWPSRREVPPRGSFPKPATFRSRVPDPVLDRAFRPLFALGRRLLPRVRVFQQGQTQLYILYILIIAMVLLVAGGPGVMP
jgi:hydrogenase-4 component B